MLNKKTNNDYLNFLFYPLSLIYYISINIWGLLYKIKVLKTKSLPCKVISVGNITVGGSGKTPTVQYLSKLLQSKGKKVGIISRGYGRKSKNTIIVTDGKIKPKSWENFGDEPYMLAKNLEGIPIIVGESRYEAGIKMIAKFNPDIIIMDDGFQHISLHRDLDIVLINSKDTKKSHRLIPLGQLREPLLNLSRADLVILTKTNIHKPSHYHEKIIKKIKCTTINNKIEIDDILIDTEGESHNLKIINSKNIFIFSALGDHEGFKKTMEKTGAIIVGHDKYPDHYVYTRIDLKNIEKNAKEKNASFIITTEKDILKTISYNKNMNLYFVRMKMVFEPENILKKYIEKII